MKHLVPIHVANYIGAPGSVQPGFKKFYLKNGYFKLYDGTNENDVVLDRPLDGFTPLPGIITAADSVLTALEKLQNAISTFGGITGSGTPNRIPKFFTPSSIGDSLIEDNGNSIIVNRPGSYTTPFTFDVNGTILCDYGTNNVANVPSTLYVNMPFYNLPGGTPDAIIVKINGKAAPANGIMTGYNVAVSNPENIGFYGDFDDTSAFSEGIRLISRPLHTGDYINFVKYTGFIGNTVFRVNNAGDATANKFIKIGGTSLQYLMADGSVSTGPSIPTIGTWGTLNYPTWTSGTPFVTMTAAGTFALSNASYYPNSNPAGFVSSTFVASNYYPLLTNPAGYLTQQSVLEFPTFTSFPLIGAPNTIYIAVDTDIAYYWDGISYVTVTSSSSGITGFGTINTLPKFTPTGSQLGNSRFTDNGLAGRYGSSTQYVGFLPGGNTWLNLVRSQAQMNFVLGNPQISQEGVIDSVNTYGSAFISRGYLALRTGAAGTTEGLRILSTGQIQLPQTPATGATTDSLLLRDSAGNLKQIAYPSIPSANGIRTGITTGTDTYAVTIAGVTSYVVNDTYIIQFSNANTGAATLNINGLGPINLFKYNDVPVLSGDISAGHQFIVSFDGTNFELIGIRPNQLFAFITNDDSVTINKGQPVYAFGAAGNRMSVKLAANTADVTSAKTLGLVFSSSIAPNQTGLIIIQGVIENINTAAFSPGDTLYLGATAGSLTNVKPYAPNHLVYLGIVERANAGNGQIYVRTQNGYELDELHDVDLITNPPLNNHLLVYETSSGLWKNKSLAAIGGGTVTNVSAVMTNPSQTVAVTNPTTTPNITIDDTNLLYNKFAVNQYAYLFPSDANTLWDTLRVGGTLLQTGTVSALSELPMGQLFQTALAVGSVTGFFGTNFGAVSYFGSNFEFDFSYRFRINTNNGAQRFFAGLSNMYGTATPTNIEPTNMINSVGVAKLQASPNLHFIWNDATGVASSLDLGSGFLGTDTTSTYRIRIYKQSLVPVLFIELYKVTNTGVVTVTTNNITGDYNTGVNHFAAIWMGNNTAVSGAVSFKNYGCQLTRRGLQNA